MPKTYKFKNETILSIKQRVDKSKQKRPKRNNNSTTFQQSKYTFMPQQLGGTFRLSVDQTQMMNKNDQYRQYSEIHNLQQSETHQDPQIKTVNQYQMTFQDIQSLDQQFVMPAVDLVEYNFQQSETHQDPQIQTINQYQMTIQETQSLDQQFSRFALPAVDLIEYNFFENFFNL
ncbi:hypothetical protein C2G38_2136379 [Gigaspora rosea]|uniref:Uncharacterized protein n=1 Tax=Gigaspora rosea TaxID=44941 RepID=A0A397W6J2_9GLOM|nr:hypothetical protein C2G38_2136379 [Gigaspora rosea]